MATVDLDYDVYDCESTRTDLNPIILLHGFMWNKYSFRNCGRDLNEATKRKVFCLDLRNHGDSPSTDDITFELMTKDIIRFLEKHNLEKVAFVCHSFSSTMAYSIALDKPDAVEKLLMIDNPPFVDFNEDFNREGLKAILHVQNRILNTLDNKMTLKDAKTKLRNFAKMAEKGQEHFYSRLAHDLTKKNGKFQWKKDFEYLFQLYNKGFAVFKPRGFSEKEILIIRCSNSESVSDSKFEAVLRHNPNASMITFENSTHLLMFEEPEKFIEAAKTFLQSPE